MSITSKGRISGSHMELGKKETISQSHIKTDDRGYKFFRELLSAIHKSYKET